MIGEDCCTKDCGRKRDQVVEGLVLYGPVADSTAYCQGAKTNIPSTLATTDADTKPKEEMVSNGQSEAAGGDVDLQAVGEGLI